MTAMMFILGFLVGAAAAAAALGRRVSVASSQARRAQSDLRAAEERHAAAQAHHDELLAREHAAHEAQLQALMQSTEEKLTLVCGQRDEFATQMKALSGGILRELAGDLAKAAARERTADREATSAELGQRAQEIRAALAPVSEQLTRLDRQVTEVERERRQATGAAQEMFRTVTGELARLRSETGTLVSALKRPQVRGSWGEMQLRNCVEAANMTAHVDFHTQRTLTDADDARLRPDLTVKLPAGKTVIVDAKVPLEAYLAALEAGDEVTRAAELDRHARQLRAHLDALAAKAYHARLDESPEFVVCFVPNEAIYCAALDRDPSLLAHGADRQVLIATPTTLMALLHAVHYGWRQDQIEASAREIAAAARELHKRCAVFLSPLGKVGRTLTAATTAYNEAVGSLEARVLPQLRRIEDAGAGSERRVEAPVAVDVPARPITAPELRAPELRPAADEPEAA